MDRSIAKFKLHFLPLWQMTLSSWLAHPDDSNNYRAATFRVSQYLPISRLPLSLLRSVGDCVSVRTAQTSALGKCVLLLTGNVKNLLFTGVNFCANHTVLAQHIDIDIRTAANHNECLLFLSTQTTGFDCVDRGQAEQQMIWPTTQNLYINKLYIGWDITNWKKKHTHTHCAI